VALHGSGPPSPLSDSTQDMLLGTHQGERVGVGDTARPRCPTGALCALEKLETPLLLTLQRVASQGCRGPSCERRPSTPSPRTGRRCERKGARSSWARPGTRSWRPWKTRTGSRWYADCWGRRGWHQGHTRYATQRRWRLKDDARACTCRRQRIDTRPRATRRRGSWENKDHTPKAHTNTKSSHPPDAGG
jgi:hypothetical protein